MSFPKIFNCQWGGSFFLGGILTDDVVRPSPRAPVCDAFAHFCDALMYSLRSIHWYPSHLQYVKDSQITRGRPSGGDP